MFKAFAATALAAGLAFATAAQAQVTGQAPPTHPGSKIAPPVSAGGATFDIAAVGPPLRGGRESVYTYQYSTPGKMQMTISIFETGRRVASGSDTPAVLEQFTTEVANTERGIKENGFTNFARPPVPSACPYGAVTFRCTTFSASSGSGRFSGKLLLTGYRDYFVRIRVDWLESAGRTVSDADRLLQGFVPALLR